MRSIICLLLIICQGMDYSDCKAQNNNIRCFQLTNVVPVFSLSGKIETYDSSVVKVYYYGNKRLYDLMYNFDSSFMGKSVLREVRHHYLLFTKDSSYGIDFDLKKSFAIRRVNIDSAFRFEWVKQNNFYSALTQNISELISSVSSNNTIIDTYVLKSKIDSSVIGRCMFTFAKKPMDLDVTLSTELDSLRDMKLVKSQIISFSRYMKEYKLTIAEFYMTMELKELVLFDESKIIEYFRHDPYAIDKNNHR
ncbi:MAG: hypothetical protein HYU71_09665 [Bacteroidetes bacterium]|nr:hypothetical protein [Bacteroidota bacterium]